MVMVISHKKAKYALISNLTRPGPVVIPSKHLQGSHHVSICQYFWVQCQSKFLSWKMSVFVSIFSGKSEIVSIFHLMVGNKDFYHLKR